MKYNKITIYHAIYIRVFFDGNMSYLTVSKDDFMDKTNNDAEFTELRKVFEKAFDIKVQEVSVLKYLNFLII